MSFVVYYSYFLFLSFFITSFKKLSPSLTDSLCHVGVSRYAIGRKRNE